MVSIPNGMEFYLFKTSIIAVKILVSIPNGMEFYQGCRSYRRLSRCFNSQRDRILLRLMRFYLRLNFVSIPNGMEFYQSFLPQAAFYICCFNSQRDGILLFYANHLCTASRRVSIPNGMEFYIRVWLDGISDVWFQFPTGWNSTWIIQI